MKSYFFETSLLDEDMGCVLSTADISGEGFRIKINKEIAKGGFGEVLLCEDIDGGDKYAVKKMLANSLEDVEKIEHEANMHKMFEGVAQIVQLVAFITDLAANQYFLVFPYYSKGTIGDELEKRKVSKDYLSEEQVLRYFESVCCAVEKIHEKGYGHRDLKPANFLITSDGMEAHLTDFGSADELPFEIKTTKEHYKYIDESGEQCSMPYRAPELFSCDIGTTITDSIDIWSLGCCLYAFCYFSSPFDLIYEKGGSIALAAQSPHKIPYPEEAPYSDELITLIKDMLQVEPENRPKINELLEKCRELGRKCQEVTENGSPVTEDGSVLNV